MIKTEAYNRLVSHGVRPSVQRLAIMEYLLTHYNHPTVEDVYKGLCDTIRTLSRTTVYNTLRMFADHRVAQMITIDEHRVCYDGRMNPHAHFYCIHCNKIVDLLEVEAPIVIAPKFFDGNMITEAQLYYKGVCKKCQLTKEHS